MRHTYQDFLDGLLGFLLAAVLVALIFFVAAKAQGQPMPPRLMPGAPGVTQGDAASRQMALTASKPTLVLKAVVPVIKTVTISWTHDDPTCTFNVYRSLTPNLAAMVLIRNVTVKEAVFPVSQANEFFGVRAVSVDGVESDWAVAK